MAHGIAQNITDYISRLKHFVNVTSPSSLLYSDKEIRKAQEVLSDKEMQKSFTVEEMTHFKRVTDATIHPASNEIIPALLRVSAIAPVNVPIVFCMLQCPASNMPMTLFLHWLNQSYNTACNYANRSGKDQSIESTATAYVLAVGSACTFAYGLGKAYKLAPPSFRHFGVMIPILATVAANVSNLSFTRMGELTDGAPVFDSEGEMRGLSKIAGYTGVAQTAVTRCMLVPCACMLLPSMLMGMMKKRRMLPTSKAALTAIELTVIYGSLQLAMPAALAVFPQVTTYRASNLESQFHALTDSGGKRVSRLTANKGL